jgi:hypothetical protein
MVTVSTQYRQAGCRLSGWCCHTLVVDKLSARDQPGGSFSRELLLKKQLKHFRVQIVGRDAAWWVDHEWAWRGSLNRVYRSNTVVQPGSSVVADRSAPLARRCLAI